MPVTIYPAQDDKPAKAFITCDKRNDIGRVQVDFRRMEQWLATGGMVAATLAEFLGVSRSSRSTVENGRWHIGTVKGKKHIGLATMVADGSNLGIALGGHAIPVADVLTFEKNTLLLDRAALIRMVDNPMGDSDTETPDARRKRLKARVDEEKSKGTKAFQQVVANEENISVSRLKQLLNDKPEPVNRWEAIAGLSASPSSKKMKPKY